MRPLLYLLLIGFMAYFVWSEETARIAFENQPVAANSDFTQPLQTSRSAVTALMIRGGIVYLGDAQGTIDVITPAKPEASVRWVAHSRAIRQLSWQDNRLLSVSADGTVALWSTNGVPEKRDRFLGHHLNAAVTTKNGALVVAADRGTVARLDVGHRWRMSGIHARAAFALSLAPDQERVVSGGADGMLRMWRLLDGHEELGWSAHKGWVTDTIWIGENIWSVGSDGRLRKWDVLGNRMLDLEASTTAITSMAIRGATIVTGSETGHVRVFDASLGRERWRQTIKGSVMSLGIGPKGVYVGQVDGSVSIWDMTNGRSIGTLRGD